MTESDIKNILNRAKQIHQSLKIPSNDIANEVNYIKEKAIEKPKFVPCGCVSSKTEVSQSFRRALNNFTQKEKAQFFLKNVTVIKQIMESKEDAPINTEPQIKKMSIYFFNQNEKEWQTRQIQINMIAKSLLFKSTKQEIDLQNYILRVSKKKDRKSLALQSVQILQLPQIMRISNNKQSFQEFSDFMDKLLTDALRDKYMKRINRDDMKIGKSEHVRLSKKVIEQSQQINNKQSSKINIEEPNPRYTDIFKKVTTPNIFQQNNNDLEQQNLKKSLIKILMNTAGLQEQSKNKLVDLKNNRLRKLYNFNLQQINIPNDWICDNLMNCSSFKRWKKSLLEAKIINNQKINKFKVFMESHKYKEKSQVKYIYKRQKVEINQNQLYFIDTPAVDAIYEPVNGKIEYCIWKFKWLSNYLYITIECKIYHGIKLGSPSLQLSQDFIGDLNYICNNFNQTLLNDTDMNINTILFEQQYLQQIDMFDDVQELDDFYTIDDNQDEPSQNKFELKPSIKPTISEFVPFDVIKNKSITVEEVLKLPISKNRLKFKHPNQPYIKSNTPRIIKPKLTNGHPYWDHQWKFTNEGEMININKAKIEAQSGVLKSMAKTITKNLFSGKSILNMSLPVTVFSCESNLSLLCKSYSYAPLLLERATKQKDPVNRLKHIVAFAVSCNVAYIQMDKPFNPILGQTFQTLIDGCPVFGEQISHHPPISATFMKGRNYTIYGNFEAKVNLGLNTATGSNQGYVHVSFNQTNLHRDVVKFNFPPGEISGLTLGDRKLAAVKKSYFLDIDNMIYIEMNFNRHKGVTQYCKYIDGMQGKIVQLDNNADISNLQKINKKYIKKQYGTISGRWTKEIYFQDQLIFDSWTNYPFICQEYPCPLQSNAFYRKDLLQRIANDLEKAQTAKQELQEIQRNDRKLRKKYTGKEH